MTGLDRKIIEAIAKRGLTPRPYAYFLARNSIFWTLAIVSVLLGAIAVAVIIFAGADFVATGGRGFDALPLDDILAYVPFVWIATLALFMLSALYSVRQTRRGYRFRTLHVVSAAILASVVIGGLLHLLDVGSQTHQFLQHRLALYDRLTLSREDRLNDPDGGFLAGRLLAVEVGKELTLEDFQGHVWTIDIAGATLRNDVLAVDEDLAIDGTRTGPATFKASAVRDWD